MPTTIYLERTISKNGSNNPGVSHGGNGIIRMLLDSSSSSSSTLLGGGYLLNHCVPAPGFLSPKTNVEMGLWAVS